MWRHGDLLIVKVEQIPEAAIKQDTRILAEGEQTGHMHELDLGKYMKKEEVLYFKVPQDSRATLIHPEHKAITFDAGEYKVVRQREYTPDGWKVVID